MPRRLYLTDASSWASFCPVVAKGEVKGRKSNSITFLIELAAKAGLNTLVPPGSSWFTVLQLNGGGNSDIQYNSCCANIGNGLHYSVIAMRRDCHARGNALSLAMASACNRRPLREAPPRYKNTVFLSEMLKPFDPALMQRLFTAKPDPRSSSCLMANDTY
jgi:hypothetical protein